MSYTQFYNNVVVDPIESTERLDLGQFTLSTGTELAHVRVAVYKHGTMGGSERGRLVVTDVASGVDVATGHWMNINEIEAEGTYWIGWVRFDFDRFSMPATDYRIGMELENYTRNGDTYYFSVILDQAPKVYTQSGALTAELSLWGYND